MEITGQGILADLTEKGRIPKTPILGPIYAFVIDRCGNCKQGKSKSRVNYFSALRMTGKNSDISLGKFIEQSRT